MRGPCDRVGFARACRVLDEELSARPFLQNLGLQLPGGVELVITREDDAGDLLLVVAPGHQIAADDLQPTVALPDFLPKVACAVTGGIGRASIVVDKADRKIMITRQAEDGRLTEAKSKPLLPSELTTGTAIGVPVHDDRVTVRFDRPDFKNRRHRCELPIGRGHINNLPLRIGNRDLGVCRRRTLQRVPKDRQRGIWEFLKRDRTHTSGFFRLILRFLRMNH
jgi:hypothetical protein